jgi:MtN3 and saliva related transmembrane protein
LKVIKSRQTKDISLGMYVLTVVGFALWLAYGILEKQWPLVASNSICFMLSGFILLMKVLSPAKKEEGRSFHWS